MLLHSYAPAMDVHSLLIAKSQNESTICGEFATQAKSRVFPGLLSSAFQESSYADVPHAGLMCC